MTNGHVALVGLMGTGKSTIGRRVAVELGRPFIDTDAEVERLRGKSVREIFADDGEDTFREIEHRVLEIALSERTPVVVAAAGGVILRADNRELLEDCSHVVWLDCSVEELVRRIGSRSAASRGHRPLIDGDPGEKLAALHRDRESLYRHVATVRIDVSNMDFDRAVNEVLEAVLPRGTS